MQPRLHNDAAVCSSNWQGPIYILVCACEQYSWWCVLANNIHGGVCLWTIFLVVFACEQYSWWCVLVNNIHGGVCGWTGGICPEAPRTRDPRSTRAASPASCPALVCFPSDPFCIEKCIEQLDKSKFQPRNPSDFFDKSNNLSKMLKEHWVTESLARQGNDRTWVWLKSCQKHLQPL